MATKTAPNPLLEKMKKALALHQAGEVEKAQRIYKTVLKKAPNSSDATHLLGVTYRQLGYPQRAFDYIQKAIALAPDRAPYYANLARTMSDMAGTSPESILAVTQKALSLDPKLLEARNLQAIALSKLDRKLEAEEIFQQLIVEHPNHPDAYRNYGILLKDDKRYDKAVAFFNKAALLDPDNPENYVERARARGEVKQFDASRQELENALKRFPNNGDLHHEMARLLFKIGEAVEGLVHVQIAVKERPKDYHRLVTYGVNLFALGRFAEAIEIFKEVLEITNDDQPVAKWNMSLAYLSNGQLSEGWKYHKSRFEDPSSTAIKREFEVLQWEGQLFDGKRLLLWNDQGIGDALRNASMVQETCKLGGEVILEIPPKLVPLFQTTFPELKVRGSQYDPDTLKATAHDYELQCSLTDLAEHLRPEITDFAKAPRPFLTFDKNRARAFHDRLGDSAKKPVVGFAWRSGHLAPERARWYLSMPDAAPILETPDVTFVNLQYSALAKEIAYARERTGADLHYWEDVDLKDDLEAAAALTACVDLVITANTSVGDLAGALDIPCWRFGSKHTIILLGQENPPWFPSMKYYRIPPDQRAKEIVPQLKEDLFQWRESADLTARRARLGL